ncbi:ABC transporter ATP-binding protein [Rickettsiaceae bacterium]|nr:ABC transporter ATP-binding protein [Rickettsiaceae bacterium]
MILKRLVKDHVSPYKKKIFVAIFFMVVVAACTAIIVQLVRPAVDEVFLQGNRQMLVLIPFAIFIVHSIKGIAEYFQGYIIKYVGQQILTDIQILMYEHLLFADFLFIQSQSSGRLISRFTNDIVLMRGAVSNMLVGIAKYFLSVLFLIIIMFSLDPLLSVFVFLVFPLAIYPVQKLGRRMRLATDSAQNELGHFTSKLDESFRSISVIKSFCTEEIETNRARTIISKILTFYKNSAKFDSLTSPIMEILSGVAIACVLLYGGNAIIEGTMTAGSLFAFITAFVSAYRPFKSLVALNVNLQEGIAAANRIFNLLDTKPSIRNLPNPIKPKFLHPNIEFMDINLTFDDGKVAIKSFSLKIESGKTYAFVGMSGSGKTSIANMLVRFFDPTSGEILIDGHDIKQIEVGVLRNQIAMVTQDSVLFDVSVADNIAYGRLNVSRKEIIDAAKDADAHEFIESLPQGYDTAIGMFGSTLSGGQKQRLAIARAFIKDAPILLLDEATSALDPRSEQSVVNSIAKLRKGRTTLIITHRLSSITDADKIIVMKGGSTVEQGTHLELLSEKKEYFKLYNKELEKNKSSSILQE